MTSFQSVSRNGRSSFVCKQGALYCATRTAIAISCTVSPLRGDSGMLQKVKTSKATNIIREFLRLCIFD